MSTGLFVLRYRPGTPLGDKYPGWDIGNPRPTRQAAEAVRDQCPNAASIDVVEVPYWRDGGAA